VDWSSTTLLVVGGNIGRDSDEFLSRYHPARMVIFEPIPALASELSQRYAAFPNVHVYPIGVDGKPGTATLHLGGEFNEASSTFYVPSDSAATSVTIVQVLLSDLLRIRPRGFSGPVRTAKALLRVAGSPSCSLRVVGRRTQGIGGTI
jgi:FkbM family methyltransferase